MSSRAPSATPHHLSREQLNLALLEAHATGNLARLAALYADAAAREALNRQTDVACFFRTQAWIYALDAGDDTLAGELEEQLRAAGRLEGLAQPAPQEPEPETPRC